jgi:hypothetical protein
VQESLDSQLDEYKTQTGGLTPEELHKALVHLTSLERDIVNLRATNGDLNSENVRLQDLLKVGGWGGGLGGRLVLPVVLTPCGGLEASDH